MSPFNPYNFVPLQAIPGRKDITTLLHHHRIEGYSGHLTLQFHTITPVFIPSTDKEDVEKVDIPTQNGPKPKITFKRFYRVSDSTSDTGIATAFPGTTIKGMIRSVFEALTNSCMALYSGFYKDKSGNSNTYLADVYKNIACKTATGLCMGCSAFGRIDEAGATLRGKVIFSDAKGHAADIETGVWNFKPLLAPKPERHAAFYAKDVTASQPSPKGRKFYFHHDPSKIDSSSTQKEHDQNNRRILERLKANSQLNGELRFQNLTQEELSALLFAVELCNSKIDGTENPKNKKQLGHKIGMAKPLGYGSISIKILDGWISEGGARYTQEPTPTAQDLRKTIDDLKNLVQLPDPIFLDLFSLDKHRLGTIVYPSKNEWFNRNHKTPLGSHGEYGDDQPTAGETRPQRASDPQIDTTRVIGIVNGKIKDFNSKHIIVSCEDGVERKYPRTGGVKGVRSKDIMVGLGVSIKGRAIYKIGQAPEQSD